MYPQPELDSLAERKRALLCKINARRVDLVDQVAHVLWPLRWADVIRAHWREISPALQRMAVPFGHVAAPNLRTKTSDAAGGLFRWAPLAVSFFRSMR